MSTLDEISDGGTAIWLDDMSQARLIDPSSPHSLAKLIETSRVVGVTTNPSIFAVALEKSDLYATAFAKLKSDGATVDEAIRVVTTNDVRTACDVLAQVYDATGGRDGRVSIEVDPRCAHNTADTIADGRDLWKTVDRKNLFVKVPATLAGLPAMRALISEGISVNATLIFSRARYEAVLDAFISGLEDRVAADLPVTGIESVASFFVSRVDTEVDKQLDALVRPETKAVRGKAAIANARLAYESFERITSEARWLRLSALGATRQRPLWASTGVKDKTYEDTRYVIELVAPETVNTMPEATLLAVADHGVTRGNTISGTYDQSRRDLDALNEFAISYDQVVDFLEVDGVAKFEAAWAGLFRGVAEVMK
jgi:transaldolase